MAIKSKKERLGAREKNKIRIRKRLSGTESRPRLSVFRSGKHMYAQLISDLTGKTIAAASTLDEEVMKTVPQVAGVEGKEKSGEDKSESVTVGSARSSKSVAAALAVGAVIAKRALEHKIKQVVFDRNGFLYHGRIRAVAEGARAAGLDF